MMNNLHPIRDYIVPGKRAHLVGIGGSVEAAESSYIIRDHDRAKFERKKAFAQEVADFLNRKYGEGTVKLTLKDQYYNMREMVEPHPQVIAKAEQPCVWPVWNRW